MQKGTYTTFPKSGVDFEDILLKKVNEQAELSPVPGTPTLRNQTSESSVWSLNSLPDPRCKMPLQRTKM